MCTVSMIGDYYGKDFPQKYPWYPLNPNPAVLPTTVTVPSRAEFDALKKEVEELKELLKAAKKFDAATGQPDCEMDEKVKFIKKLAEFVGVDIKEVFK